MVAETETQAGPVVLEYGRYKLFEEPDGGWVIARTRDTCQTCQACGCGGQAEPVVIPGMVVKIAKAQNAGGGGIVSKLKAVTGRG